jgi:hypothetical protein
MSVISSRLFTLVAVLVVLSGVATALASSAHA